jgi:predicted transcriptional regulator
MRKTTIYLPEDLRRALKLKAIAEDTTMTGILRQAAERYLYETSEEAEAAGMEEFQQSFSRIYAKNRRLLERLAKS